MPRVLRIMNRMIIGGPILNSLLLTKYMAPEFETLFVVGEKDDHEQDAGFLAEELGIIPTIVPGMGRSLNVVKDYKAYHNLKRIIRDFKPDIVHTHAAKPGAVGRMAAKAMNVPVVLHTYHGHVFHSYFNKLKTASFIQIERYLAGISDGIIAISEQQKKELALDFRIAPSQKFHVIPLGFNLDKFQKSQQQKRAQFRQEFNVKDDEIAIGIIGRMVPVKNHALFLEGIQHVLKNSNKKIKAFIVGDGETRQAMEEKAKELEIKFTGQKEKEHVSPLVFTSWRSDVDVIYAGLDIVALTSLNEGTPVSLIEAQAANKPVVSTKVGGIGDIVVEGETALLSAVDDKLGFCENILRLVEDDELRSNLGENGAGLVLQKFSYQRLVNDMSRLYNELLFKKKR
ncbi:MAG TPA: glycosyltransferase [Chitinophagaceae bacterium]